MTGSEGDSGDASSRPPQASLRRGARLDDTYEVVREIGRGAMGEVYEVLHGDLGRRFAAKVLAPHLTGDDDAVARLRHEARAASAIRHDHIVDVTHLGRTPDGRVFLVMELLDGEDLAQRLERHFRAAGGPAPLPDDEVRTIVAEILSALEAAHGAGIVHRDLKPENVFLARRGAGVRVTLCDFGISKLVDADAAARLTETGRVIGTPRYIAPEQLDADVPTDERADLYALAVLAHEMLTGGPPFRGASLLEVMFQHASEPPERLRARRPDLPAALEAVLLRALEKDPARRFPDAAGMAEAWRSAWRGGDLASPPDADLPALPVARRGRLAWAAAGALAVGAALFVMVPGGPESAAAGGGPPAVSPAAADATGPAERPPPPARDVSPDARATAAVGTDLPTPAATTVRLSSRPPARVFVDGAPIGTTPLPLPVADDPVRVELRARGHVPRVLDVPPGSPPIDVALRPRRRASAPPPMAPL